MTQKITVSAPIEIQRRCLKIASEKNTREIEKIINALKGQPDSPDKANHMQCYQSYLAGWRGNYAEPEPVEESAEDELPEVLDLTLSPEVAIDMQVARKYMQLASSARSRGKDFELSIVDVRRLLTLKRCEYTGVELTQGDGTAPIATDRTIDRLDSTQGYVRGNVYAVCHQANHLKNALFENQGSGVYTGIDFVEKLTAGIRRKIKTAAADMKQEESE